MMRADTAAAALLTPAEMAEADRLTIEHGTGGVTLMRRAGEAVARTALGMVDSVGASSTIAVLAGPGNNGGDGFAAALLLAERGLPVELFVLGGVGEPIGDAATFAREWQEPRRPLSQFRPDGFALVIDALFGAGLSRPLPDEAARVATMVDQSGVPVLAVDLPSGVSGADGLVRGAAFRATKTVTFFRRKPGHLLEPGRAHCGPVEVADIGIRPEVLDRIGPRTFANEPSLFHPALFQPADIHHKYDRGHAVVFSGSATRTGAARLSAMAALRGGAGLVTVFSPSSALLVHAAHLTAIMLKRCDDSEALEALLEDRRLSTFVLGPGFGDLEKARAFALQLLAAGRALVLDADAISAFADEPTALFEAIREGEGSVVLTPHDGEFKRLFPDLADRPSKLERARQAAARSRATVVLKGSDTVIASPDGRAAINATGSPSLATAGTGDVLTGLVAAQLANGVAPFEAALAAVWLHGEAARDFGPGLIAEDLPALIPKALRTLDMRPD